MRREKERKSFGWISPSLNWPGQTEIGWHFIYFKGGPEPLENEINKIWGSKREDRFSDHFPDLVQNICSIPFSCLLRLSIFCKAPRDMRKFPQKCQKIAGCWESAVYGSRPPIASKTDSSPPEQPSLDNVPNQPWSDATCPCTITSTSAYLRFVTIFLLEKTIQSTRSGNTGASHWVASDHRWLVILSRLGRSGGDKPGFEAIRGREH